jgi:hypothetical protein
MIHIEIDDKKNPLIIIIGHVRLETNAMRRQTEEEMRARYGGFYVAPAKNETSKARSVRVVTAVLNYIKLGNKGKSTRHIYSK